MSFEELAKEKRYSCRNYLEKPLTEEDLGKILEAGRVAPTAANLQPQRIIAINTPEGMEKLAQATPYTFGAPAAAVVCYDRSHVWIRRFDGWVCGEVDSSIVTTHMMLQAADLGVGTCWVGFFDPDILRAQFRIPNEYEPVAILIMGYPGEKGQPHPVHWKREPLENTVVFETFENE